jgi:iron complex transport system ATP-binding protein
MSSGLVCRHIALRLGGREILRGVDFSVEPGEVVGLLGRNGAGKTSLLRAVARSVELDSGWIALDGRPIQDYSRRELARRLAVVPQDLHVPFPFLAGEVVLMGRAPHQGLFGFESRTDVARAREAMQRMGIADLADRSIFQLSGGERQLVLIARALAQEPELLLLDEPTAFLDLRHRIDVLRAVRQLAREGRGALVVSHDLALAARICDRLVVLGSGVVVAEGRPHDVLTPDLLSRAFGMRADVLTAPDGSPVVVPRMDDETAPISVAPPAC